MLPNVRCRDLSARGRLLLTGPDRKRFLHGMVTNDVNRLTQDGGCHAAMLTVKGKLLGDLCIYDCGEEGLLLELEGSATAKVATALERHIIMDDVTVLDRSGELAQLGVYGDGAGGALAQALGLPAAPALAAYQHEALGPLRLAATPELGVAGFHVFGPGAAIAALEGRLLAAGAAPLDEAEAEALRIEAGRPRYGLDMDEDRLPVEAGLDDAVSFDKGCYLGQEVIARVTARGHVNRKLMGLRFPGGVTPPPGAALSHESRPGAAGAVTSVARSPRHGAIGLGYVHRTLWEPGTRLEVVPPDGGEALVAEVCALPFSGS